MKAADIMTSNVVTIDSLATLDRAAKLMQQYDLKTSIVERALDSDAYGIITTTDISRAIAKLAALKDTRAWFDSSAEPKAQSVAKNGASAPASLKGYRKHIAKRL